MNLDDADNILQWARRENLDIVFNMVQFHRADAGQRGPGSHVQAHRRRRRADAPVLHGSRADGSVTGRPELHLHALRGHDFERVSPHGAVPVQTQGIMLNPNGDLFFCENSDVVGNVLKEDAEAIYFPSRARIIRGRSGPTSARRASARAR